MIYIVRINNKEYEVEVERGKANLVKTTEFAAPVPQPAAPAILIYNLRHKDKPKELLTEEEIELLTSPLELATYKSAITSAMFKGTARNIESEENINSGGAATKNAQVG